VIIVHFSLPLGGYQFQHVPAHSLSHFTTNIIWIVTGLFSAANQACAFAVMLNLAGPLCSFSLQCCWPSFSSTQ
jgi:hypothetical protein